MLTNIQETITPKRLTDLFEKNRRLLFRDDTAVLSAIREKAFASFSELGFPDTSLESWRLTDLQ